MPIIRRDFISIMTFTLKMIGVWIIAYWLLIFFRNYGIASSEYFEQVKSFDFRNEVSLGIVLGVVTGFFYAMLEIGFDRPFFQKMSYGKLIFVKNILYFIAAGVIFFFAVIFFIWSKFGTVTAEQIGEGMSSNTFWVVLIYFMLVSILISFILQINQKFGPGMLWKFLIGKYHLPIEEERLFLFLDLQASTTLAEKLGHLTFSRLIQDCFYDLTDVVRNNRVDIYQYVGDEAVLSWDKDKGFNNNYCLHAYYDFMEILNSRSEYYLENYGHVPFFKAGLHVGTVVAAEVGVVKKEIAYHGDVLNTAARIQGECNKLQQPLLVSEDIINSALLLDKEFEAQLMEASSLKGKNTVVNIYGVQPIDKSKKINYGKNL